MITPGLFNGVYSYLEAARLLGVSSGRVKRWADGYTFARKNDVGVSPPILQTDRTTGVLSFPELWELMFVKEYAALGVSIPRIRETAQALSEVVGEYPFSSGQVMVSGRELLVESAAGVLQRPDVGQFVADFALSLAKHIEIRGDRVSRYNPPEFEGLIYLDRERRGGEPVVSDRAIATRVIHALWMKEQSVASVSEYFELSPELVSAAVRYEGQWRLAA